MKELIRTILREEIQSKYRRLSPELNNAITKMIISLFRSMRVEYKDPKRSYGNVDVEFCLNGRKVVDFSGGNEPGWDDYDTPEGTKIDPYASVTFDKKIVDQITSTFNIRRSLALHLLTEYFEDKYINDISQKYKINFNDLDDATEHDYKNSLCEYELIKDIPNYDREQILDYIRSTGRGGKYWEEQDDEQLQISFEHIWGNEKQDN
jgi:hypothetical protein